MKVFILTRYTGKDSVFGSIAVFKTLRIGFPTAEIHVYSQDFFEHPLLPKNTIFCGRIEHYDWIKWMLNQVDGPCCFVDTDMIFYENVEPYLNEISELMAGRYIPSYRNPTVKGMLEVDRLHTSLLYISNAKRLREFVSNTSNTGLHPYNPYAPFQFYIYGKHWFYDTMANVFHSIPSDDVLLFEASMLDKYTHLVSGTMLNAVSALLPGGERLKEHHRMAEQCPESVRGLWKEHNQFYANYSI